MSERTIDGADVIEADTINIFEKLEINGTTGNPKQVVRLKDDGSETIEFSNLEVLTFTGASTDTYDGTNARTINIPSALTSAGNPLVITGNQISFNGFIPQTITATGSNNIIADLEITGDLEVAGNLVGDSATNISLIDDISANSMSISGNINANGNILGDNNTDINFIRDISSATLTTSGDITANGNINGDGSTNITGMASIVVSTITNSTINSGNGNITNDLDVGGILTATDTAIFTGGFKQAAGGGNFHLNSNGNLSTSGNISATAGNITAVGSGSIINGLQLTGNLNMSSAYDIQNANAIGCASLTATGDINSNGNIVGDTITNITGINDIFSETLTATGNITANGNIVGDGNTNLSGIKNVDCQTLTLSGTISSANIPSSISGAKTFTGTFQTNGNTTLCNSSGDLFIGDFNQTNHNRPTATFMGGISQRFNIQSDLVGDEAISGRLEYQKNLRIQQRSYHSPYQLSDYFFPNAPSTTCLYDPITKLTGDTNRTPYRVIKIHPQNWLPNEDSTVPDIAIFDPGTYPTTGTSAYGGLMARHSAIIEAWSYFDIPEGLKLKAVFIRVASSTSGASFVSRNVKVFKRHLGELSTNAQYSVKIVDGSTATSSNTPIFALTSGIDQQDLLNEYDSYMAIRCELNNLNYVLMGGYAICEPVDMNNLAYSLDITSGSTHYSNFTITIKDQNFPNTTLASKEFTNKNQTKNFIIGYTYGATRQFIIQFGQTADAMNYQYSLSCNRCEVEGSTSPTIDDVVSNGLTLVRQTSTISFNQIPA